MKKIWRKAQKNSCLFSVYFFKFKKKTILLKWTHFFFGVDFLAVFLTAFLVVFLAAFFGAAFLVTFLVTFFGAALFGADFFATFAVG